MRVREVEGLFIVPNRPKLKRGLTFGFDVYFLRLDGLAHHSVAYDNEFFLPLLFLDFFPQLVDCFH